MVPHSEWPQTMILFTSRTCVANSSAASSEISPPDFPVAVAGGTILPTLRTMNSSPGPVDVKRFGSILLSEQVIKSVCGFCSCAKALKAARPSAGNSFLNRATPASNLFTEFLV